MKLKYYLTLICISLSAAAFSQNVKYLVKLTEKPFRFEVLKEGEPKPLLVIDKGITLQHFKNNTIKARSPYFVWTKGKSDKKQVVNRAIETFKSDSLHILVLLNDKNDSLFKFQYKLTDNKLDIKIAEINPPKEDDKHHSRIGVNFSSLPDDSYLGMGMRFNQVNHKGTIVTTWCREVGYDLPLVSQNGSSEGQDITYYPVPFFLNLKGYGFLLNSFYFSEFDFAKTNPEALKITNYSHTFDATLFLSENPLEIIGNYQKATGNYTKPKPWVFGVWGDASNDWQTKEIGQVVNEKVLKICRENKIPLSAIWAEDWYWNKDILHSLEAWTLNEKQYPDYKKMIEEQHKAGVKHISYIIPYLPTAILFKKSPLYEEAKKMGYFTKNKKGDPYVFQFAVWRNSQFDWTNPEATKWFCNKILKKIADSGADGWVGDFGEYTPYNSISYNGEYGLTMHNKYPLLWAKNADNFWKTTYPDKDFVIIPRSGFIGQQSNAAFHFTGDRNATYDNLSGLGGQIVGVTNSGISAHPNTSIDVGAYNCFKSKPMDKLMMFRWIEMGALIPVMRLHRGLPLCDHWRFDEDKETLEQWKKYAKLHAKLFPYIYTLAQQAEDKGLPMVRHLSLQYPKDKEALKQDYQFMLGDRILSAPVITEKEGGARDDINKGTTSWKVYLPTGNWYHYWTNKKYAGNATYDMPASPGFLPMFIQEGKIIPTFNKEVDTFVENVEDPSIKDFEYVNDSIDIYFYGYGKDTLTLWDGTIINCSREAGGTGAYEVKNGHGRNYNCVFID
ncbi:MAG: TIM-barrel domain-containing protein [Bacteroidota bacterium]